MSESGAVMTSLEPFALGPSAQNPSASQAADGGGYRQVGGSVHYAADGGGYRQVGSSSPYQSISSGGGVVKHGMNLNTGEQKRKRGRPRKYGPDGSMSMAMVAAQSQNFSPQAGPQAAGAVGGSVSPTGKKRGRPPGSSNKKKQLEAIGSTGIGFIPHVINVKAGEDVSSKIMAFSQNGPRTVCILSANGAVSNVTLRQAATSGGTATYEGRFDILSLSGSFMLSEVAGQKSRTGGLSTTLAGPDGRVFGGCVAGLLIAAAPVQVIVGSFIADGQKEPKTPKYMEPLSISQSKVNMNMNMNMNMGSGATGASSSPSRGTFSESSGGPASPLNLSSGACNNSHPQMMSAMPWK